MSEAENKAVFLSYASQDAAAARRICEALRTAGVEVWFDQSELRGGDAWDAKIRKQIKECALFVPVISSTTESRQEGYFRREWKMAVERTHDMAQGIAFIVPVVIDGTGESDALVPEEFLRVQWTRLEQGVPSPELVGQVKRLLEAPRVRAKPGAARPRPAQRDEGVASAPLTAAANYGRPRSASSAPGRLRIRWIAFAVSVVAVAVGAALWLRRPLAEFPAGLPTAATAKPVEPASVPGAASDKSIAVIPFVNLSDDKDANAFFSDGVHEDILTNLALIRELRVVSRTSVEQYRGTKKTMPQIGRELGVSFILEGSVRRSGATVRFTGQLINARTDEHVWAKSYNRELKDVFAIQAELANEIANALRAVLSPEEKKLIERRPTENAAAYDLYLKAKEFRRMARPPDEKRVALLQAAVTMDPEFAAAWADLCYAHAIQVMNEQDTRPDRAAKAKAALEATLRLSPDSPEALRASGQYSYYCLRDYEGAAAQFNRLIALQPNAPEGYFSLGAVRRRQGRWTECLSAWRKGLQLDPHDNLFNFDVTQTLLAGRRYAEARVLLSQRSSWSTPFGRARGDALVAFQATGSAREWESFLKSVPAEQLNSQAVMGWQADWAFKNGRLAEFLDLDDPAMTTTIDPIVGEEFTGREAALRRAIVLAALGRKDAANEVARAAETALDDRGPNNAGSLSMLGRLHAVQGRKDEALKHALRAVEVCPESVDAFRGPGFSRYLAFVYAWTGNKELAIAEYARLLRVPFSGLNIHEMKSDPTFQPLRGDPRFEALLNDPKNNAPLF